jgi:hypothetical protein
MTKRVWDKYYGTTTEERLEQVPAELAIDAVGLWQIVSFGMDAFELSGADLVDYVRRHILSLLSKGAKPVRGAMDGVHYWKVMHYGNSPDEIADAIIAEWLKSGRDPDFGGVWFALPHIYEETKEDAKAGDRKFHS